MKFSFKIQQYQTDAVDAVALRDNLIVQEYPICVIWEVCLQSPSS